MAGVRRVALRHRRGHRHRRRTDRAGLTSGTAAGSRQGRPSRLLSRADLEFLLYDWLKVESLISRPRFRDHSRFSFNAALDLAAEVATEHFASHLKVSDAHEPVFEDGRARLIPEIGAALQAFAATGLFAGDLDEDLGGIQLPHVVAKACFAWFQAANIGTAAYPFLTLAAVNLLVAHASAEQIDTYVRPMVTGRFHGTMCLSEEQAGSSLGDIAARAESQSDGAYRLSGSKMWISGGDHELSDNIVHLVLARIAGAPPGVNGLSLFIVPKYLVSPDGVLGERNDVALVGLNHKMGYRGTTNTVLSFGSGAHRPNGRSGAVGHLVGAPNRGLFYTFHMMNEARIGVGAGAAAIGYTGYLKSLAHARARVQGRHAGAKDARSQPVPIIEHADVKRMLLAQKSYVEGALALVLYCGWLVDEERTALTAEDQARAQLVLDVLTPIAKSWPSQWCLTANDLAIQIHGGCGYTRDYDVEQHYRDNRLNPIHEGTTGIQALDLLGRKMGAADFAGLRVLAEIVYGTIDKASAAGGEIAELAARLRHAFGRVEEVTHILLDGDDLETGLANASLYLDALGHVVVAWTWLEQFLATGDRPANFYEGKRRAARYFFAYELTKTDPQFDLLASRDRITVEMTADLF